jgi:hypothetical protein
MKRTGGALSACPDSGVVGRANESGYYQKRHDEPRVSHGSAHYRIFQRPPLERLTKPLTPAARDGSKKAGAPYVLQGWRFVRHRRSMKRGSERSESNMGFAFIYPTLTMERSS